MFETIRMVGEIVASVGLTAYCIYGAAVLLDMRWYRKHPGAEEEFSQTDIDLTRKGL